MCGEPPWLEILAVYLWFAYWNDISVWEECELLFEREIANRTSVMRTPIIGVAFVLRQNRMNRILLRVPFYGLHYKLMYEWPVFVRFLHRDRFSISFGSGINFLLLDLTVYCWGDVLRIWSSKWRTFITVNLSHKYRTFLTMFLTDLSLSFYYTFPLLNII